MPKPLAGWPVISVIWTPQAVEDVEAIRDFIRRDSGRYASFVVERLLETAGRLEASPGSGRVVPEFEQEDLRELLWEHHRIVHQVHEPGVIILTVHRAVRLLHTSGEA